MFRYSAVMAVSMVVRAVSATVVDAFVLIQIYFTLF